MGAAAAGRGKLETGMAAGQGEVVGSGAAAGSARKHHGKAPRSGHEGRGVDVFYLNFNKAFNTLSHNIFIDMLRKCGLDGCTAGWIKNWLKGRAQRIVISEVGSG
ncbi:hypothetical protein TURU_011130 [Turdus rufiventris]|nr:hypothetical protein TURU_011130 [Turdus rufiventris]